MSNTNELLKEFEKMLEEKQEMKSLGKELELDTHYSCEYGLHKWKFYRGFHMDQFYYCELCDAKDKDRKPPI